jgi:hypothetical protein
MARISWSNPGKRVFEAGVDRGVLYVGTNPGVAWTGLVAVNQGTAGGQAKPRYLDGIKIGNRSSLEDFEATIEAFTYPPEFEVCDGTGRLDNGLRISQQRRESFGMTYRTKVGNDLEGLSHGYKIHFLYNLKAEPSDQGHKTLGEEVSPLNFAWKVTARPPRVAGHRPSAHFWIDSRDIPTALLESVEDVIYGTDVIPPRLPTASELVFMFDSFADDVYDAGTPYTPVFVTYDAGTPATSVTDTIDGGAL